MKDREQILISFKAICQNTREELENVCHSFSVSDETFVLENLCHANTSQ